jgi:hypothetical protein
MGTPSEIGATATAVAVDVPTPPNLVVVTLPVGLHDLGVEFADGKSSSSSQPPTVSVVDVKSPLADLLRVGLYVHGIRLPNVEIIRLADSKHLRDLIQSNVATSRQLLLSPYPHYVDESLGSSTPSHYRGAIYKHVLPASQHLGFTLRAFPPIVSDVVPGSPMHGRLLPGQTVQALLIPGERRWDLAGGAFTSMKVQERLDRTWMVEGRRLVVNDAPHAPTEKGSRRAFVLADCVVS